jgi:hypothetical protein
LDREDKVLEYVKKNRGCTKTKVVDYMDPTEGIKSASPQTTFKIIKGLITDGKIISDPDKSNSSIHHLYFNDRNTYNVINSELSKIQINIEQMGKQRLKIMELRLWFQGGAGDYDPDYLRRLESRYWIKFQLVAEIMLNNLLVKTGKEIQLEIDSHKLYLKIVGLYRELGIQYYRKDDVSKINDYLSSLNKLKEDVFPHARLYKLYRLKDDVSSIPIPKSGVVEHEDLENFLKTIEEFRDKFLIKK